MHFGSCSSGPRRTNGTATGTGLIKEWANTSRPTRVSSSSHSPEDRRTYSLRGPGLGLLPRPRLARLRLRLRLRRQLRDNSLTTKRRLRTRSLCRHLRLRRKSTIIRLRRRSHPLAIRSRQIKVALLLLLLPVLVVLDGVLIGMKVLLNFRGQLRERRLKRFLRSNDGHAFPIHVVSVFFFFVL